MNPLPNIKLRDSGIPSTKVTNELATLLNQFGHIPRTGSESARAFFARSVKFKLSTSSDSTIGRYTGKIYDGATANEATGNLADADIGTIATADDCVVWNLAELAIGAPKHILKTGVVYEGFSHGDRTTDGKLLVIVSLPPIGETASPTTFSPSGTTAESGTWSRASNGTPVTIALATRTAYDSSGHVLYNFTRSFAFDACGLLLSISAETRSTVDSATSCS